MCKNSRTLMFFFSFKNWKCGHLLWKNSLVCALMNCNEYTIVLCVCCVYVDRAAVAQDVHQPEGWRFDPSFPSVHMPLCPCAKHLTLTSL